ncbi:flagellar FlbD family protein [Clostridium sp. SM-530-WT-3G]|uniref:flagellar FlbD family protein n=1 Tax=Clostridium sp. SM-530-WT-3G TaxID=2725303 RepID=UPI00145FA6A1|nr:flagellar FlbD family protein [Clostridium sp. SM-530-WT-3G]NME82764.1 flagellar FlbD family protein [Clostridium sp. SM-530-WT-3G]
MIDLTAMNNMKFTLNDDHIEKIESVPETVITLSNGKKYLVLESIEEIKKKIINFKRKMYRDIM